MGYELTRFPVWAAAVVALVLAAQVASAQDEQAFVVIVHPDNDVAGLTRNEISNFFLKERVQWSDGTAVEPVDLAGASDAREDLSFAVHNRSSANIRSYWQQQIFSGGKVPPVEVDGDVQVVEFVKEHRGAIGYVSAAAELTGVRTVGLIVPPVAITRVPAQYTAMARRFGVEGAVRLRLVVGTQGRVEDVEVLQGLKHGLNEQAVRAVRKWKFDPATLSGQPVQAPIEVTLRFTL